MNAEAAPAIGRKLPIIFTYRDTLFGPGFVVEVHAVNGHALCVHEDDGFWMYGVNPGGMAAHGEDVDCAHAAFRAMFSDILKDLAAEAQEFEEFRELVESFFNDTNIGFDREWHEAVRAIRNREVDPGLVPPRRVRAESPREIHVTIKKVVSAKDNQPDLEPALAA